MFGRDRGNPSRQLEREVNSKLIATNTIGMKIVAPAATIAAIENADRKEDAAVCGTFYRMFEFE